MSGADIGHEIAASNAYLTLRKNLLRDKRGAMNSAQTIGFTEYLKNLRSQKSAQSSKQLFLALGGDRKLGVSLRTFQAIESGDVIPPFSVLAGLITQVPKSDWKALFLSFIETSTRDVKNAGPLREYISSHLTAIVEASPRDMFAEEKHVYYSEEQLDFLIKHPACLRFHKRVLLQDRVEVRNSTVRAAHIDEMIDLGLIERRGDVLVPAQQVYRVPVGEGSTPRLAAKGTDFVLKHIEAFVSREGRADQQLNYSMQMVRRAQVPAILDQTREFKQWVQEHSVDQPGPEEDLVPVVYVGFVRQLGPGEL